MSHEFIFVMSRDCKYMIVDEALTYLEEILSVEPAP